MSKYLLTIFTLLLLSVGQTLAQSDENVSKRRPDKPAEIEVQEIRQEVRTQNQANPEMGVAKRVAANHSQRLSRRFKFYETRLTNIIARFQARLDFLKEEGKSVDAIQTKLDLASAKLEEAVAKATEAIAAFDAIQTGTIVEQKSALTAARSLSDEARELFQEAHELLKQALRELKTISKPALPAASPAVKKAL